MSIGKDTDYITKLTNGADYPLWKKEIQLLFRKASLIDIITGTTTLEGVAVKEKDDTVTLEEAKEEWRARDAEATLIIYATVDPTVKRHVMMCESAHQMYKQLQTLYERDDSQHKCMLLQAFYNFNFDDKKDVLSNMCDFETIVYRLKGLGEVLSEDMQITRILENLPEKLKHFPSNWDATPKELRNMIELKSRLQKEETRIKKAEATMVESTTSVCLNAEQSNVRSCFKCGQPGHYQRFCKLVQTNQKPNNHHQKGYYQNQQQNKKPHTFNPCRICSKRNHLEKNCHFGPGGKYYKPPQQKKRTWNDSNPMKTENKNESKRQKLNNGNNDNKNPQKQTNVKKVSTQNNLTTYLIEHDTKGELCAATNRSELCAADKSGELCAARNVIQPCVTQMKEQWINYNVCPKDPDGILKQSKYKTKCSKRNCQELCCMNLTCDSLVQNQNPKVTQFCVDSGATVDFVDDLKLLQNPINMTESIRIAKKEQRMTSQAVGTVKSKQYDLQHVRFVPAITKNLMSVGAATDRGQAVLFSKKGVKILKHDIEVPEELIMLQGERSPQGLFVINLEVVKSATSKSTETALSTETQNNNLALVLHRKMGHLGMDNLRKLPRLSTGLTLKMPVSDIDRNCEVCIMARLKKLAHDKVREKATAPLRIIHTDVCGPVTPQTHDGKSYYISFLDDYTHFCVIFLMERKSEAFKFLQQFVTEAENYWNKKVYKIRSDNGTEYKNKTTLDWLRSKGIVLDTSNPYCPQQNGKAERLNRTIAERMRSLMFDSGLDPDMWGEAALASVHLINRSPTSTVSRLPAELWYQSEQDMSKLQLFGSVVYAKSLHYLKKLDSRAQKAIFVGYGTNGYRLWNQESRKIFMARDVYFTNKMNPTTTYRTGNEIQIFIRDQQVPPEIVPDLPKETIVNPQDENQDHMQEHVQEHIQELNNQQSPQHQEIEINTDLNENPGLNEKESNSTSRTVETLAQQDIKNPHTPEEFPRSRYSLRDRRTCKVPSKFDDYILNFSSDEEAHTAYILDMSMSEEANLTYDQCVFNSKWLNAIQEEKDSLEKNKVWTLVDRKRAQGKQIVTSRWIFKVKDNGTYKARLVARGFQQRTSDLNYEDTFSPVVDFTNLRVIFALAAQQNSQLITFDVKTAFLHGLLEEEIFMEVPDGYHEPGKVCLLKKALYGLKQSSQKWYNRLALFLVSEGYKHLKIDRCIWRNEAGTILLAIHVDDGIISSTDEKATKDLLDKLRDEFEITIDYSPTCYLGIQISRTDRGICLHQTNYATQVLEKYNMSGCNPVCTPMDSSKQLQNHPIESNAENFPYRQAIGSLLYLSNKTRPDLAYSVNCASRHITDPSVEDIFKLKRILRYLKGTTDLGIFYSSSTAPESEWIYAYSDSDYAQTGGKEKRKSTTGLTLLFAEGPIAWASHKQAIIATSTTEAEYIAAAECVKEIQYIKTLFEEITGNKPPTLLHVDNEGAISIVKTGQMTKRSKHIDVRYYFIIEKYEEGLFKITHCSTQDQLADIFTKPLDRIKFSKFRNILTHTNLSIFLTMLY